MAAGEIDTLPFCGACGWDLNQNVNNDIYCDACGQDARFNVTTPTAPLATGVNAGAPGDFTPTGSRAPVDFAELVANISQPNVGNRAFWAAGDWCQCINNDEAYWDGSAFQAGKAPLLDAPGVATGVWCEVDVDADAGSLVVDWANGAPVPFLYNWTYIAANSGGSNGAANAFDDPANPPDTINVADETAGDTQRVTITGANAQGLAGPTATGYGCAFDVASPLATVASVIAGAQGILGHYTNGNPAETLIELQGMTATPLTAWTTGQTIPINDGAGTTYYWDSAAWQAGVAP